MNERIRELFEQAGGYAQLTPRGDYFTDFEDFDPEKLAELIVRECAGIVDNKIEVSRYVHEAELLRECSTTIKQHFGVEE